MAEGGGEALEGPEELGLFKDTGKAGSQPKGVKDVFRGGCTGGSVFGAET